MPHSTRDNICQPDAATLRKKPRVCANVGINFLPAVAGGLVSQSDALALREKPRVYPNVGSILFGAPALARPTLDARLPAWCAALDCAGARSGLGVLKQPVTPEVAWRGLCRHPHLR